jgi:hypothetical protein
MKIMESCHKYTHVEVLFDGAVLDRDRGHRSDEGAPRRASQSDIVGETPFC